MDTIMSTKVQEMCLYKKIHKRVDHLIVVMFMLIEKLHQRFNYRTAIVFK